MSQSAVIPIKAKNTFEKRLNFVLMKTKIPNMRDKITGIKWE